MKAVELTVTRIGNSRGVRLPARILRRYRIGETILLEERENEIALKPKRASKQKLTWEQTYKEMAAGDESWSDWEGLPEGLHGLPGEE